MNRAKHQAVSAVMLWRDVKQLTSIAGRFVCGPKSMVITKLRGEPKRD
jgi:hypothetical protein